MSEIPGGLVVLGGDNVSPLVKIGLADLPNIGGAKAPPAPTLRQPCKRFDIDLSNWKFLDKMLIILYPSFRNPGQ